MGVRSVQAEEKGFKVKNVGDALLRWLLNFPCVSRMLRHADTTAWTPA